MRLPEFLRHLGWKSPEQAQTEEFLRDMEPILPEAKNCPPMPPTKDTNMKNYIEFPNGDVLSLHSISVIETMYSPLEGGKNPHVAVFKTVTPESGCQTVYTYRFRPEDKMNELLEQWTDQWKFIQDF